MVAEIVVKATSILPPLSGKSIDEIIKSYPDDGSLPRKILDNPYDFQNAFMRAHEHTINVDGLQLRSCHNIQSEGSDSILYVFLHGLGGNIWQFEPLLRLLDLEGAEFFAMDLPGFGQSQELQEYPMLKVVKIIRNALRQVTNSNSFVFVGHSMGCHLALHLQQQYQSEINVSDLVFLAPASPYLPQLDYLSTRILLSILFKAPFLFDFYRSWFDQSKGLRSSGIKQFFYAGSVYRKLWQFHNNVQIKSRSVIGYLRGWEPVDWPNITFTSKIQIIAGEKDPITPLETVEKFYSILNKAPGKELIVLKDCSHNICFDQPVKIAEKFNEILSLSKKGETVTNI